MKCPSCKSTNLMATRLEEGLPAHGCPDCGGAFISLLYYREWAERTLNDSVGDKSSDLEATVAEANDSEAVLTCPKCAKFMTKFDIAGCAHNRLDLCASCDEAWLDGGEWELLKALQLSQSLPSVFTDAWQRRVRKEISEQRLRDRYARIIDESDMKKADDIRSWIRAHEKRAELLFYIGCD